MFNPNHTKGEQGCSFVGGLSHLSKCSTAQNEVRAISRALVGYDYSYTIARAVIAVGASHLEESKKTVSSYQGSIHSCI